ncbi:MAG TPA: hypothetical protein VLI90_08175 [Tepidisphaeraceae bacterium]|nr:hypothetical protein [Tepidisphaeraceae bacterium]
MSAVVQTWWPVLTGVLTVLLAVATLWVNSKVDKAIKEERVDEKIADAVQKVMDKVEKGDGANSGLFTMINERVAKVEGACAGFAPASDFNTALLKIVEMGGDMKAIRAELVALHNDGKALKHSVDRLYDVQLESNRS